MNADAIFVFAGRESRKRFGVRLFREGFAPRLVLSVGRFEWRRFAELGLPEDGGLVERVPETEPKLRHFFVDVRTDGARCERIRKGLLGTWSEARALAEWIEREGIATLAVISHRQHLYRCLLGLRTALSGSCALLPLATPRGDDFGSFPERLSEAFKFLSYMTLLAPLRLRNTFASSHLRQYTIPGIKSGFTLSQPGLQEGDYRPPEAADALSPLGSAGRRTSSRLKLEGPLRRGGPNGRK